MYAELLATILLLNFIYFAGVCCYDLAMLIRERGASKQRKRPSLAA